MGDGGSGQREGRFCTGPSMPSTKGLGEESVFLHKHISELSEIPLGRQPFRLLAQKQEKVEKGNKRKATFQFKVSV